MSFAVSVDDRRALWALTERHLRSETFAAVLAVRHAIRRGAADVRVESRRHTLTVIDDGDAAADEARAVAAALATPHVGALHALEAEHGTDLLVLLATAAQARLSTPGFSVDVADGHVRALSSGAVSEGRTTLTLHRPPARRAAELRELRAWLVAPRARIVINGRTLRAPFRLLDEATVLRRAFSRPGARGLIAVAPTAATSRSTILARGVWVGSEQERARGLPTVALWDDDDVASPPERVLPCAREIIARAAAMLIDELAARFPGLPLRQRVTLRRLLLRDGALPAAFVDVPLFDSEAGPFTRSLRALRERPVVVLGDRSGDVLVDAGARGFLHAALAGRARDALPAPRRRLRFLLRGRMARLFPTLFEPRR